MCNCNPVVVKPLPLPRLNPQPRTVCQTISPPVFRPIGDRCSCGNSVVVPAIQPRPTCSSGSSTPRCSTCSSSSSPCSTCSSSPLPRLPNSPFLLPRSSTPGPCQGCQVCVRNQCVRVPPFIGNLIDRMRNNNNGVNRQTIET